MNYLHPHLYKRTWMITFYVYLCMLFSFCCLRGMTLYIDLLKCLWQSGITTLYKFTWLKNILTFLPSRVLYFRLTFWTNGEIHHCHNLLWLGAVYKNLLVNMTSNFVEEITWIMVFCSLLCEFFWSMIYNWDVVKCHL